MIFKLLLQNSIDQLKLLQKHFQYEFLPASNYQLIISFVFYWKTPYLKIWSGIFAKWKNGKKKKEKKRKKERKKEKCPENEMYAQLSFISRKLIVPGAWGQASSHITWLDFALTVNMAGSVEARFDAAVNVVRSMPKKGINQSFHTNTFKKERFVVFVSVVFFLTCVFSVEILRCLPTFVRHDVEGKTGVLSCRTIYQLIYRANYPGISFDE